MRAHVFGLYCVEPDTAALPLPLSAVPVGLVKAQAGQQALCFRSLMADLPLSLRPVSWAADEVGGPLVRATRKD